MLTKEQILGARDFETVTVPVPEWGGEVMLRGLTGAARDQIEQRFTDQQTTGLKALVVASSMCDEDGKLLMSQEDVEALNEKSGAVLDRLFDKAWELSGIAPGAVEDAEGN